mmetsp:Transcript_60039/g.152045  ORF Transcript_60039/g.152045 Transcript_60039/m.152045 type:complete len:336 (-) Transcript_60039:811-1818(-)
MGSTTPISSATAWAAVSSSSSPTATKTTVDLASPAKRPAVPDETDATAEAADGDVACGAAEKPRRSPTARARTDEEASSRINCPGPVSENLFGTISLVITSPTNRCSKYSAKDLACFVHSCCARCSTCAATPEGAVCITVDSRRAAAPTGILVGTTSSSKRVTTMSQREVSAAATINGLQALPPTRSKSWFCSRSADKTPLNWFDPLEPCQAASSSKEYGRRHQPTVAKRSRRHWRRTMSSSPQRSSNSLVRSGQGTLARTKTSTRSHRLSFAHCAISVSPMCSAALFWCGVQPRASGRSRAFEGSPANGKAKTRNQPPETYESPTLRLSAVSLS